MTTPAAAGFAQRAARNRALAALHIAKARLGLDDETYRGVIRRVSSQRGAEVESAGKLDRNQMRDVLNEFRRLGAKRPGAHKPANYPGKPHNFNNVRAMPEMITRIEQLLADMGLSWAYADAIAKRQCGIPRCAWVREQAQLRGIIAALDVEQQKRDANAFIDKATAELGMGEKQLAELTAPMPKNWRRNRRCLDKVCQVLVARVDMLHQKQGEELTS